jgi:hypothetical protein
LLQYKAFIAQSILYVIEELIFLVNQSIDEIKYKIWEPYIVALELYYSIVNVTSMVDKIV